MWGILIAALVGVIAGAVGGGLGVLVTRILKLEPKRARLVSSSCAIAAVVATLPISGELNRPQAKTDAERQVDELVQRNPDLIALKQYYPDDYARLKGDVANATSRQGATTVQVEQRSADFVQAFVAAKRRAIGRAGPREAKALIQVEADAADRVAAEAPTRCGMFVSGETVAQTRAASPELTAALDEMTTASLAAARSGETAVRTPAKLSKADIKIVQDAYLAAGGTQDELAALGNNRWRKWEPERTCTVIKRLFHVLAAQPDDLAQRWNAAEG